MQNEEQEFNDDEKSLFQGAIEARDENNEERAIALLELLLERKPNSAVANVVLAGIYFNREDYDISVQYFKKATQYRPKSKLSSLGYHRSLWKLGRIREALKEAERFLLHSYVENYDDLVRELMLRPQMKAYQENKDLIDRLHQMINRYPVAGEDGVIRSE